MRIAFVAHNFIRGNGQGRINYEIARHAARRGNLVTLLADQADADLVSEQGISWEVVSQRPRKPNLLGVQRFAAAANRRLRKLRRRFDVIVGTGYTLTERHDVNLCQFVHGAWEQSPVHVARLARGPWAWYQRAFTRCNAQWERDAYHASDIVVAPSEKIRAELVSVGVDGRRIAVIPNGVDLEEFHPPKQPEIIASERAALGLPTSGPLALFVGDIRTARKNLDSLLKALARVPNLHLAIVGEVRHSPFPRLAQQLGVLGRTTFAGYRRDVSRFMRASDFFAFPSRYEAGTLVLIEALASGLAVITAATAGGCEIMTPDCGRIVENPEDILGLANAMAHFASSPDARREASAAARQVAEKHSWKQMAQRYLDILTACDHRPLAHSATPIAAA